MVYKAFTLCLHEILTFYIYEAFEYYIRILYHLTSKYYNIYVKRNFPKNVFHAFK